MTAGDRTGCPSVTVAPPSDHSKASAWLLAGELLVRLRRMAEEEGFLKPRS